MQGRKLLAERGLEVAHVLLRLDQERAERFRHIGQSDLARFLDALAIAIELLLFDLEIELQGALHVGLGGNRRYGYRRHAAEEGDLLRKLDGVLELLAEVRPQFRQDALRLEALDPRDVLDV